MPRRTHERRADHRTRFHRGRRAVQKHTFGLLEAGGGAISAATVLTANQFNGAPVWMNLSRGDMPAAMFDVAEILNPMASDPTYNGPRVAFWTGVGIFIAARILRRVAPSVHKASLKIGRHTKVALW